MLSPGQIIERLEEIEQDLATRQNELEEFAEQWTRLKRDKEKAWAEAYVSQPPGAAVTDKKAEAIKASAHIGVEEEARYVGLKSVVEVLQARASIGQTLLNAQKRIG